MHTPESRQRAYDKVKARRITWFAQEGPCKDCGTDQRLEVHHVDPKQKIDHRVFSWSEERRRTELAKCIPLCNSCHKKRTRTEIHGERRHGTSGMYFGGGCRCKECVAYSSSIKAQWRERTGRH